MKSAFAGLLVLNSFVAFAGEALAHEPPSIARQRFNQVFVKVIMPVTERTPQQDGPAVESWVTEHLKERGVSEYFAVTGWVPVCDGLLTDDVIDNRVWGGQLTGKNAARFCPVGGDLPERKDGHVTVFVNGWDPGGGHEVKVILVDEPGTRVVEPVLPYSYRGNRQAIPGERPLAYVAVLIGPPPRAWSDIE